MIVVASSFCSTIVAIIGSRTCAANASDGATDGKTASPDEVLFRVEEALD
jgi:hypothetical protein